MIITGIGPYSQLIGVVPFSAARDSSVEALSGTQVSVPGGGSVVVTGFVATRPLDYQRNECLFQYIKIANNIIMTTH